MAVASRVAIAPKPITTSPDGSGGWTPTWPSEAATSGAFITPVAHPRAVPTITFGHLIGQVRIPEVAEGKGDPQRWQDATEHNIVRQFDHAQHEAGEHEHVE